jgi:DNA adenine methylase
MLRATAGRVNEELVGARPVVKWAGGKTRLLDRLTRFMPPGDFETYAEPFAGGAALFFWLASEPKRRFKRAILADKNAELVALYQAIKSDVDRLIDHVGAYQEEHLRRDADGRREHFYEVREKTTASMLPVERGARLLFLNRTCFNGLWRVNASGQFNVPFGRYTNPRILDERSLRAAHEALEVVTVKVADFAEVTRELREGDFAYFDPPYVPVSKTANFTAYAADRFGEDEQVRLAAELARLHQRGVRAMLSNAYTPEIAKLYRGHAFTVDKVPAPRAINSDPNKRGDVAELVVTTYRQPKSPRRKAAS